MKYRIIFNGVVQGVGCRSLVRGIAKQMHLGGIVRNTEDGCVEIYTETDSDQIIQKFVKEIKRAADGTMIDIMQHKIFTENQNEYLLGKQPKDFGEFRVEYDF